MTVLDIRTVPDPILKRKTNRVSAIDRSVKKLIKDMCETLHAEEGRVGLAAPQIGVSLRITVIGLPDEEDIILINPEVVRRKGIRLVSEGCLSIPGYVGELYRAEAVTAKALDIHGKAIVVSQFTLMADTRKGNRPSFIDDAQPEIASSLVDHFIESLSKLGIETQSGEFGADMLVEIHNDGEFVKMIWRFPSKAPDYPTLEEADIKLYETKGFGWDTHVGNLGNGMVGIMLPDNGDKGLYYACVGPAGRQAEPLTTDWHFYPIAATHTFFELRLASTPQDIIQAAKKRAQYDLYYANKELRKLTYYDIAYAPLDAIFDKAAAENQKGDYYLVLAQKTKGNESIINYAKAVRGFTMCQAYARQVYESLVPPADKPTDLGLGEWFGSWGEWESCKPC